MLDVLRPIAIPRSAPPKDMNGVYGDSVRA